MGEIGFIVTSAITLTCIYGTLAIGISITWSSLGLVNLAYGFIFALAGYGAWLTGQYVSQFGLVILAAGILTGAVGGVIVCALAFIPIHDKPNFTVRGLIATLAINLIGVQTLMWWFGPRSKNLPEVFGTWKLPLGGFVLTANVLGGIVSSLILLTAVLYWMKSSRRGLEIRAMTIRPRAPCRGCRRCRAAGSAARR